MKDVANFVEPIEGFSTKSAPSQIEVFAWFLHEVKGQETFSTTDLGSCFDHVHIQRPPNIASSLSKLVDRKRVLRSAKGHRLAADARSQMATLLPVRATSVKTTQLLNDLVPRVSNAAQKTFLNETLLCFKQGAYRATIVMAWNLAYSHVCDRIMEAQLAEFNAQRAKAYPRLPEVVKGTDFEDYKESQVIEICRGARVLDATVCKHLSAQLNRRNSAAHPSSATFTAAQAEDMITDLVNNVLLNPAV